MELSIDTSIEYNDEKMIISVSDGIERVDIKFEKDRNAEEYPVWRDALLENVEKFNKVKEEEMSAVEKVLEEASMNGYVRVMSIFL